MFRTESWHHENTVWGKLFQNKIVKAENKYREIVKYKYILISMINNILRYHIAFSSAYLEYI